MLKADDILSLVQGAVRDLPYARRPAGLYEPIVYTMGAGGKRIRPVLLLMSYNLFNAECGMRNAELGLESALSAAMGLETYHNYTLLHDDLMDKADVRRGRPTVHKKWNANTAILSGDSMLVLAFEQILKVGARLPEVLELCTKTALEIGEGQQFDMDFEEREDVTEAEYIEMIRLKTSVLLACACKMGALLAGADEADQERLYKFGETLGLAFQLQDDYLDCYGDERTFGKAIGGDISNGKKTFLYIKAGARVREAMKLEGEERFREVLKVYDELGVPGAVLNKIESYFAEAAEWLEQVAVGSERKEVLRAYMSKLLNREL